MAAANFNGLRVLSLESRRAVETAKLISTYGGGPLVAPAMREIALDSNQPVLDFAEALLRGAFDLVIFTTGVGVKALVKTVSEHMDREAFLNALRSVKIAARGPKSSSALRELGVPISVVAPDPLQRESRQRRKSMREIAEAILLNEDLRKARLGDPEKRIFRNVEASEGPSSGA